MNQVPSTPISNSEIATQKGHALKAWIAAAGVALSIGAEMILPKHKVVDSLQITTAAQIQKARTGSQGTQSAE